jgi:hypothetical protein
MQPGYPGSGQDPYNQQPPSDPFGNPNYGQYPPQQPDPYAQPPASGAPYGQQPASGAPYGQPDPYAQPPAEYSVQPPTSGQPYDPYNQGQQQPYYQQPQSAPPVTGYPQAPAYQAPVAYPGAAGYTVPGATPAGQGNNPLAIVSMILGIVSIVLMCCYGAGILFGGVALVLGFLGMNKSKNEGLGGRGMALAGVITGGIGAFLSLIWLVLIIIGYANQP